MTASDTYLRHSQKEDLQQQNLEQFNQLQQQQQQTQIRKFEYSQNGNNSLFNHRGNQNHDDNDINDGVNEEGYLVKSKRKPKRRKPKSRKRKRNEVDEDGNVINTTTTTSTTATTTDGDPSNIDNENMDDSDENSSNDAIGHKKKKQVTISKLKLDDAISQGHYEGWSGARIRAWNLREKNPNAYYYRFNDPGEKQKMESGQREKNDYSLQEWMKLV